MKLAIFMLLAHASHAAILPQSGPIPGANNYLPMGKDDEYDSIADNEIGDEFDYIQGLYPPKPSATDYYTKSSKPAKATAEKYVIDTVNKVVKQYTNEGPNETKLKPDEEAEIKKLSAAFVKALDDAKLESFDWGSPTQTEATATSATEIATEDWKKLKPIITVSKSGVSFAFANETATEPEVSEETTEDGPARDSLWTALTRSVERVLLDEFEKRLNATDDGNSTVEEFETETESPATESPEAATIGGFVSSVWSLLKTSLHYVGELFTSLIGGEETPQTEATPPSTTEVFALEEQTGDKKLPSEEFGNRRRDTDSIFYGYGIV